MQPDWWKYVVDVAQILSAIGTCGAVVVALWVALSPPRLHMSGSVGMRILVGQGVEGRPEYVHISITNNGEREFVISGLAWVTHRRSTLNAYQSGGIRDANVHSDVIPHKLSFGETASFFLPAVGNDNWFGSIESRGDLWLAAYSRRESLKKLRLYVYTSVGQILKVRPEDGFLDELWKHIAAAIAAKASAPTGKSSAARQELDIDVANRAGSPH